MPIPGIYLPTDRIRFESQLNLLRAYGSVSRQGVDAVTNDQIAEIAQIKPETASLTNQFFAKVGFITWVGGGYHPSDAVKRFQQAFDLGQPTAGLYLKPLLMETWFWQTLANSLDDPLSKADALGLLRDKSGLGRNADSKLEMLLEYLVLGGLIYIAEDYVYLNDAHQESNSDERFSYQEPEFRFEMTVRGLHIVVEVDPIEYEWTENGIVNYFKNLAQQIALSVNMSEEQKK